MPGVSDTTLIAVFWPLGSASSSSLDSTFCWRVFCVSMSGVSPLTVIVSSTAPTCMSALTVAVKPAVTWMPSRFTELKPASENVTT